MNWKRGLFRAWVMLSLVWVAFAFVVADPVGKIREATTPVTFTYRNVPLEFPGNLDVPTIRTAVATFIREVYQSKTVELTTEQAQALANARARMSLDELASALRAADAAGNVEEAVAIANAYRDKKNNPPNPFDQFDSSTAIPAIYADNQESSGAITPERAAEYVVGSYHPKSAFGAIAPFVELASIPPLLLLALASCLWWVARGFRTTE